MKSIRQRGPRLLALVCAAALCLALAPGAGAADSPLKDSGASDLAKLSRGEIVRLLADNPTTMPSQVFAQTPSVNAPYATGAVSQEALQGAVNRLNALRRLAGLPAVALDPALCENAQYGAVLTAHNGALSHSPAQPADMDSAFFQQAYSAVSSSNLSAGRTLCAAPDFLMDDSDAYNVAMVGHRRWQLNPSMGKVGFGYALNSQSLYGSYVVEKVFDRSGGPVDYDFIAWPASGSFPGNLSAFTATSAWSVTLNPDRYQTPVLSQLTVTLTRLSDGATWTLSGRDSYTPSGAGRYLNVNTGGYGVSNCIIFRPDGTGQYQGSYQVTIDGLKTPGGQPTSLRYQVDFFDTSTYDPLDVPSDWARDEVDQAVAAGLVPAGLQSGYTRTATRAEFCALAVQLYERATGTQVAGRTSFTDTTDVNVEKAAYLGVVNGVGGGLFRPNDPLNREQAAVMLARLADALGSPLPAGQASFGDLQAVSPWAVEAVGQMQASGIMQGIGGGRFAPALGYSREQSIVTALHLYQQLDR